jgi:DNA-binding NtrC family response regulator
MDYQNNFASLNVLIIKNFTTDLKNFIEHLKKLGIGKIEILFTKSEAINSIRTSLPRIVFLDVMIQENALDEIIGEIYKQDRDRTQSIIIAVYKNELQLNYDEDQEFKAQDYIDFPFTLEKVKECIEHWQ